MAVVTKTIIAGSGGDYTTVAAWEAATNLGAGADIWKGVISDNSNYDENVTINVNGTSVTSYVWLTVASGNRHVGVAGTGHARMRGTGASHIITIDSDFCRISWLEIKQAQAGASDEGIRVITSDEILIQYCIIWTDTNAADQDGIYHGTDCGDISVDNCLVYGWRRAALHSQLGGDAVWHVDHCGLESNDQLEAEDDAFNQNGNTAGVTLNMFNTWLWHEGADRSVVTASDADTTLNGSNNLSELLAGAYLDWAGTDNSTGWVDASDGLAETSKTTGSWLVLADIDASKQVINGLLLDDAAGNLAAGGGVNRQGSEYDSRQDFSVDITGGARPTTGVDIGPHQVSSGAVEPELIVEVASESDVATGTPLTAEPVVAVEVGSESDTAVEIVAVAEPVVAIEVGAESDIGSDVALAPEPLITVEQGSEVDTGVDVGLAPEPSIAIEEASESDAAIDVAVTTEPVVAVEVGVESDVAGDTAIATEPVVTIEPGSESDVAVDIVYGPVDEPDFDLEAGSESDVAVEAVLAPEPVVAVAAGTESDTAVEVLLAVEPVFVIESASESDTAGSMTYGVDVAFDVEQASESDTAIEIIAIVESVVTVEQASESDLAIEVVAAAEALLVLEPGSESDVAAEIALSSDRVGYWEAAATGYDEAATGYAVDPTGHAKAATGYAVAGTGYTPHKREG